MKRRDRAAIWLTYGGQRGRITWRTAARTERLMRRESRWGDDSCPGASGYSARRVRNRRRRA